MIYVDEKRTLKPQFRDYCHMWSDSPTTEELHQFAASIGLKREWFQDRPGFPHYDLSPGKRALALESGAQFMPLRDWVAKFR